MGMTERYLIQNPTSAASVDKGVRKLFKIPSASFIEVALPVDGRRGLIEVKFNGETVLVFAEDIRQRGKLVPSVGLRR